MVHRSNPPVFHRTSIGADGLLGQGAAPEIQEEDFASAGKDTPEGIDQIADSGLIPTAIPLIQSENCIRGIAACGFSLWGGGSVSSFV